MQSLLAAAAMTAALAAPDAVLDRFMAAWSASDAKSIAALRIRLSAGSSARCCAGTPTAGTS